jgi:hypothetical protein
MVLIDDQHPGRGVPAQVPVILSQIAFALGACGGLATILMSSAVNTASKELVNWPARSPEQHGGGVGEIGGDDAAGLRGEELLPGRAGAAERRAAEQGKGGSVASVRAWARSSPYAG